MPQAYAARARGPRRGSVLLSSQGMWGSAKVKRAASRPRPHRCARPTSPCRGLETLRVVPRLSEDLAVAKLEDADDEVYVTTVVTDRFDRPHVAGARYPAHSERRRAIGRKGPLHRPHVVAPMDALPGLGQVGDELLVAQLVFRVRIEVRDHRREHVADLLIIHRGTSGFELGRAYVSRSQS